MNTQTEITEAGYAAIAAAQAYKRPLNVTAFKAGSGYGFKPSPQMVDIQGELVYEGKIRNIELLSANTIKLTVNIPAGVPATGVRNIGEIGLYLETGELFALGVSDILIPKNGAWSLDHDFVISYTRLGDCINLTVSDTVGLPGATMSTLPDSEESPGNAWVILDGQRNGVEGQNSSSPIMAVKYGMGGQSWAWGFQGFGCVFTGTPVVVAADQSSIEMEPTVNGFWCNDKEELIVATAIEAKRMVFNQQSRTFTSLDGAFTILNNDTVIRIWRQNTNENALPLRKGIPTHYALHAGLDTHTQGQSEKASGMLKVKSFEIMTDGTQRVFPLGFSTNSVVQVLVAQHGVAFDPDEYNADANLVFQVPPAAGIIQGWAFFYIPSAGHESVLMEYLFETDGTQDQFSIGTVPGDYDHIIGTVNGRFLSRSEMTLMGNTVKLNFSPRGTLSFVTIHEREKQGYRTNMYRQSWRSDGVQRTFQSVIPISNRQQTILLVGNHYQTKAVYNVNGQNVDISYVPAEGLNVELLIFDSQEAEVGANKMTGINTGPQWRDPAGWMTEPCYLDLFQHDQQSYNEQRDFYLPTGIRVPNSKYLWVFLDGVYQQPTQWEMNDDKASIRLQQGTHDSQKVTMLLFIPMEGLGYSTDFHVVAIPMARISHGQVDLGMTPMSNLDRGIFAFAGGILQDKESFQVSGPLLQWKESPMYADHQIMVIQHLQTDNWTSEPLRHTYDPMGRTKFPVLNVTRKSNVLPFVGGVAQYTDQFLINDQQLALTEVPPLDTALDVAQIYTGLPRTRLMSRSEVEDEYLRRAGGDLTGTIFSHSDPSIPEGLVNKGYVDKLIARLRAELIGANQ